MSRTSLQLVLLAGATLSLSACSHSGADKNAVTHAPASPYVAIARGQVDVEGGLIRIAAPRDGVIVQLHGAPGTTVKAGDVMAVLDPKQAELSAGIAKAELDQATAHVAALRVKVADLTQRADRAAQAAQAGAAPAQTADDARLALNELNAQIAEADAATEAAKQRMQQAHFEVEVRTLRAPVNGRVVARNAHLAGVVSAQSGTPLFTLLPDAPRIVRAELNEAFVGKIVPGMHADVVTGATDEKIYPATVLRVGDVFGPSTLVEDPQEASDTRDVECILKLQSDELRVGQRVQVRFRAH